MILSVNSTPAVGYYTFAIQASDGSPTQTYRVSTQQYTAIDPKGKAPWKIVAYQGENPGDVTEQWTVKTADALLTTANDVPAFG
jgi:hypothetical protein